MEFNSFVAKKIDADDWSRFRVSARPLLYSYQNVEEGCGSAIRQATKIPGLRLDFNFGLRLDIPKGDYHVRISDADSGTVFYDNDISDSRLISFEKHYIHWRVEISRRGRLVYTHTLNLRGQAVLMDFLSPAIGDTLLYLPYIKDFQKIHNADVKILLPESLREFAAHVYPELKQVDKNNYDNYATYYPMIMMTNADLLNFNFNSSPFKYICMHKLALNRFSQKSEFTPTKPRGIAEPYVCIAVQGSSADKTWLYPGGWDSVVEYLNRLGYRVLCIDKNPVETDYGLVVKKPARAEDFTGNRPIMDRANMLYHAEFMIGLSSGLTWLADAVDCPVVLIAGFTNDWCEFHTPYRVANRLVCNGCFNDRRVNFTKDFCYYHRGTEREMECSKKITPRMVEIAIENLIAGENLKVPSLGEFVSRRR